METENGKPKLFLGRISGRTFEEYKQFFADLGAHLGVKETSTDEEIRKDWEAYWAKIDAKGV